jgi:hypothetical protein
MSSGGNGTGAWWGKSGNAESGKSVPDGWQRVEDGRQTKGDGQLAMEAEKNDYNQRRFL